MKKLVVLILALCMLCSVAFANELTWASVEETASQIAGEFKTFDEISVKIWIPEVLQAVELSDEDRESGYIGYFASDDAAVAVQYVNMEGMSLEEYEAQLKEDSEVSDIEAGTVNGLPALSYAIKDKDTGVVAFTTEMGYILEVACGPLSNEGFAQMVGIILSSIQGC
jgi:hypothetical protein